MTAPDVNADVRARLLPCPFCGREPIPGHGMSGDVTLYNVRCRCGAGVNDFFDRQEADEAWNRRAAHADLSVEVRELVEAASQGVIDGTGRLYFESGHKADNFRRALAALAKFHPTHQEKQP